MKRFVLIGLVLLLLLLGVTSALAQTGSPYDLAWNTLAGGGATFSTGGVYSLGGTIGQPAAGGLSGVSSALNGGFWSGPLPYQLNIPRVFK